MISIQGLRVDYDTLTAVQDVDLVVGRGEVFGLVGPNGAGKTTLIKTAAGLLEPVCGTVRIADADMGLRPEEGWRHIGYMPDFPPVYEDLTVCEYLEVFAMAYAMPRRERMSRIQFWVEQVQLEGEWSTCVRELSRGMRQRLVLAKTMLHNPDVLLLDEPASGMDPLARIALRGILKEKARQGAAILISSHILSEMDDLCTALAVMEKGRLLAAGSLEDIRATTHTRRLVLQLLPPVEAALALLSTYPDASELRETDEAGTYSLSFSGDDEAVADLLAELMRAGARVLSFSSARENMESLFLKIGGKEVS